MIFKVEESFGTILISRSSTVFMESLIKVEFQQIQYK